MKKKLRAGLIGCGRFSVPGHAAYYRLHPGFEFAAVCDLKRGAAEKVGRAFGVSSVYDDYEKMLDEAGLDAVSICTPTFTHAQIAAAAAERGIHVLCEKPFAISPEEGEGMVSVCRENGVVLHVGFNKRYDRGIEHARNLVAGEKYGRCFHGEFRWYGLSTFGTVPAVNSIIGVLEKFGYSPESYSPDWRLSDPRIPGGVLEVFCHLVDLALWTFGEPGEVFGDAFRVSGEAKKPEHTAVIFKYPERARTVYLTMSNSALSLSETESALFQCTGGNLRYETNSSRQTFLPAPVTAETDRGFFGRRSKLRPALSPNPLENLPFYRRLDCFLKDIRGELAPELESTAPRGEAGLAVDRVIHRILANS